MRVKQNLGLTLMKLYPAELCKQTPEGLGLIDRPAVKRPVILQGQAGDIAGPLCKTGHGGGLDMLS